MSARFVRCGAVALIIVGCAACRSRPTPARSDSAAAREADAGITLRYGPTASAKLTYAIADTLESSIELPSRGPMQMLLVTSANYDIDVMPMRDSLHVKIAARNIALLMNAMNRRMPVPAGTEAEGGEAMLARTGAARVIAAAVPLQLNFPGAQAAMPPGLPTGMPINSYERFFPRLPAQPLVRGVAQVDTMNVKADSAGMSMAMRGTTTVTYVGDTIVNGKRLLALRTVMQMNNQGSGTYAGRDMNLNMSSSTTADWLWDPERRIVVYERKQMNMHIAERNTKTSIRTVTRLIE